MIFGPEANDVLSSAGATDIAVASTATVYTRSFPLVYGSAFGLSYKAASSGTINLKIELEQSFTPPATEGASDANWVVPEGLSAIDSGVTDSNMHHASMSPIPLKYGRLKITGLTGNDASTTVRIRRSVQEEA